MDEDLYFVLLMIAVIVIIVTALIFGVVNDNQNNIEYTNESDSKICLVEKSDNYKIYYDKSTLVMYLEIIDSGEKLGITVMHNSDGTVKLYNEEE